MEHDLISKKDLLDLTQISYGQLYRWKRKNLIPEDWFIRKSTFTGQETFFPKDKILARIEKIKGMKEDLSLDDLADVFSPNLTEILLKGNELIERNIVSQMTADVFIELFGNLEQFDFEKILYVFVADKMLQSGEISLDESKVLLRTMVENYKKFDGKNCELLFTRKMGISTFILTLSPNQIYFETGTKVVAKIGMAGCMEELKIKLG